MDALRRLLAGFGYTESMNQSVPLWLALISGLCSLCTILVVALGEHIKIRSINRLADKLGAPLQE